MLCRHPSRQILKLIGLYENDFPRYPTKKKTCVRGRHRGQSTLLQRQRNFIHCAINVSSTQATDIYKMFLTQIRAFTHAQFKLRAFQRTSAINERVKQAGFFGRVVVSLRAVLVCVAAFKSGTNGRSN